jgi:hypothetical protein
MNSALIRDHRHQRPGGPKKLVDGVHITSSIFSDCLEDVFAVALSASGQWIHDPALPVDSVPDDSGKSGASSRRRRSYHFKIHRPAKSRCPANAFEEHLLQIHLSEQLILKEYAKRIDRLHLILREEGRGIDRDSELDFWNFAHRYPFAQAGQVIVTDEGHLRLVWKGSDEAHIGIRFLGERRVRYVIFNRRAGERALLEISGEDSFDGLVSQAHACGLQMFRV